jgi:hypothetical protein
MRRRRRRRRRRRGGMECRVQQGELFKFGVGWFHEIDESE